MCAARTWQSAAASSTAIYPFMQLIHTSHRIAWRFTGWMDGCYVARARQRHTTPNMPSKCVSAERNASSFGPVALHSLAYVVCEQRARRAYTASDFPPLSQCARLAVCTLRARTIRFLLASTQLAYHGPKMYTIQNTSLIVLSK